MNDLYFTQVTKEGRTKTIIDTWAKQPESFMDRGWELFRIAKQLRYIGLPEKFDAVMGVGFSGASGCAVVIGCSREYIDNYDEDGYLQYRQFEVPLDEFMDPEKWRSRLTALDDDRRKIEEEARRLAEDKEYAEYKRLKAKYEKAV